MVLIAAKGKFGRIWFGTISLNSAKHETKSRQTRDRPHWHLLLRFSSRLLRYLSIGLTALLSSHDDKTASTPSSLGLFCHKPFRRRTAVLYPPPPPTHTHTPRSLLFLRKTNRKGASRVFATSIYNRCGDWHRYKVVEQNFLSYLMPIRVVHFCTTDGAILGSGP